MLARQLELVAERHPVVTVTQVLDVFEGGHALRPRSVLLAFSAEPGFEAEVWPSLRRRAWAATLLVPPGRAAELAREGAGSALQALVREGLVVGLREEEGPEDGGAAWLAGLTALRRAWPGLPRVGAHAQAPSAERVALLRAAGLELAFTRLAGTNDLARRDPLRLRVLEVGAGEDPLALRRRLEDGVEEAPLTPEERRSEEGRRAARARLRFVLRPLDALLTAGEAARPTLGAELRTLTRRRVAHYERLRSLAALVTQPLPPVGRAIRRTLLDPERLPFRGRGLELLAHGTAATVFRLAGCAGQPARILKVYRWTLAQEPALRLQMARRHRVRYSLLAEAFGPYLLRTHFLVLNGPLRGWPVAACLQEEIETTLDPLALSDAELLACLRARPGLGAAFVDFSRRLGAFRERGFFPDLLGPGNLLVVAAGTGLRLIDYGLFDLRCRAPDLPHEAAGAVLRRFEGLVAALGAPHPGQP